MHDLHALMARELAGFLATVAAALTESAAKASGRVDTPPGSGSQVPMLKLARTSDDLPMRSCLDRFLEDEKLGNKAPAYIRGTKDHILRAARLADWRSPADMTPESLRGWMVALHDSGLKGKTIKLYRDSVGRFCAWCVRNAIMDENPIDRLPVPKVVKSRARVVPTDDEARRIVMAAGSDWRAKDLGLALLTMFTTGLRYSECRALTVGMVPTDPARNWIDLPPKATKTKRAERVYLSPELMDLMGDHVSGLGIISGPLFRGGMKRSQIKTYARKAGIRTHEHGATLSYHSCRHFAAARLGRLGFTLEEATWAMRHMPQGLTSTVYRFDLHERIAARFREIPALLGEVGGKPVDFTQGRKRLDNREHLPDSGGAEVANPMNEHAHNTTSNGPLDGSPVSASAIDSFSGERAASSRAQGVAQLGKSAAFGSRRPEVQIIRPCSGAESDLIFTNNLGVTDSAPEGAAHGTRAVGTHLPDMPGVRGDVLDYSVSGQERAGQVLLGQVRDGSFDCGNSPVGANRAGSGGGARQHEDSEGGAGPPRPLPAVRQGREGGRAPRKLRAGQEGRGGVAMPVVPHEAAPQAQGSLVETQTWPASSIDRGHGGPSLGCPSDGGGVAQHGRAPARFGPEVAGSMPAPAVSMLSAQERVDIARLLRALLAVAAICGASAAAAIAPVPVLSHEYATDSPPLGGPRP